MSQLISRCLIILTIMGSTSMLHSQEPSIDNYRWKNRVLLIITDNINSEENKLQLKELLADKKCLTERKLILINVSAEGGAVYGNNNEYSRDEITDINQKSSLYRQYHSKKSPFLVVLIGLDGSEKFRQDDLLKPAKLFSIIDGMPMRRAEIKNKN